jgi:hypothetical protein
METRRPGLVGPIILISIGVLLLLNTLNILSWSIWETLWRFWPILLILLGLEILIGRRSWIGSLVVLLVALVAVVVIVVFSASAPTFAGLTTPAGERQTLSQPLADASQADVTISFASGEARFYPLSDSANLVEGTVQNGQGRFVELTSQTSGNTAQLTIRDQAQAVFFPFFSSGRNSRWDIGLSDQVPLSLHISTGAGEATLDLSGLKVSALRLDTGAGQTVITLPAQGRYTATLNFGVGNTDVTVPRDLAIRLRASQGLGNVSVSTPGVSRLGNEWVSQNYDTAANQADVRISGGLGNISVR